MTRINPATAVLLLGVLTIFAIILGSCHSGSDRPDVSTAATVLRGDLDGDGLPSVGDAIGILRIVVGLDAQNPIADADADGNTTVNDAIAVLRCVVGLSEWPLGVMDAPPTRSIGPGTVNEGDFVIGAGERVECLGDTIIECTTATIAGELYSSSPTSAGTDAGSITIQAQGDVLMTGAMRAGNGSDGDLSTSSGQGGDGGSVTINSANGDITIGVEVQTSADAPDPYLGAGDAGMGADDLLTAAPGAGGQGGSVTLSCPNGLLTLHPRSGLIHLGNGGDGGTGHIPADSEAELGEPSDQTPDGGDSGLLSMECDEFAGLEEQDGAIVIDPPEMLTGGNGGDGASVWICVEVGTDLGLTATSAVSSSDNRGASVAHARNSAAICENGETVMWQNTPGGGNAVCPGEPGDGGEYSVRHDPNLYTHSDGIGYIGGPGGDLNFGYITLGTGERVPAIFPQDRYAGGNGSDVTMRGWWAAGSAQPCQNGASGGAARVIGGRGGRVVEDGLPAFWLARMNLEAGRGGHGTAIAGFAQHGGSCCGTTPGPGGAGGDGGACAEATGGRGGDQPSGRGGNGGNASAGGADGGSGGNGRPPGAGGSPTAVIKATAGEPGEGKWPGNEGTTYVFAGDPGATGDPCPGEPTTTYGIVTARSTSPAIYGYPGFYAPSPSTQQLQPGFTLGGLNNMVLPQLGNSMLFNSDASRLWVANELGGIAMYSNPLSGGDRAPDRVLNLGNEDWRGIWYDEQRDIIYGASLFTALIYAWDEASSGSAERPPDRSFEIAGYLGGARLTGSPGSNRLFVATRVDTVRKVLIYDQAHLATGLQAPSRTLEPADFDTHALAWDGQRDVLYLGAVDGQTIHVYDAASTLQGGVTPDRTITVDFAGMAAEDWISALVAMPENDLLFVSMAEGQVMVFAGASSLNGTPAPATQAQAGTAATALGVYGQ